MDAGLPHHAAIDRKPESGCELQTAACGRSGAMLSAEIALDKEDCEDKLFEDDHAHATAMARRLTANWARVDRIFVGDSCFAPVRTADALDKAGLRFIGCVKSAAAGFPMKKLAETEATGRGLAKAITCRRVGSKDMMALMFADRGRKHFISTALTSRITKTAERLRWRTIEGVRSERIMTRIGIPEATGAYFSAAIKVDQHDRCRQNDIGIEKAFEVK